MVEVFSVREFANDHYIVEYIRDEYNGMTLKKEEIQELIDKLQAIIVSDRSPL